MAKTKFYNIRHPKDIPEKYLALWSDKDIKGGGRIICPADEGHQGGYGRISDLTVIIKDGNAFKYDIIWTWYSEPMINERVVKILKDEGLTGYELKPVTIKKVRRNIPEKIPLLQELCVIGHAEVHEATGLIVNEICDVCKHVSYRGWKNKLIIDEEKWDGSDFFRLPYPGGIFVSERVKKVFEKYKVTGVEFFIPSEKYKSVLEENEESEKESEKWEKYWDNVFTNLYPDLFPRISTRENKELFKWDVMYTINHPSNISCEEKKKMKRKEFEKRVNEELEKVFERWEKGEAYLFNWDDVPGKDSERFLSFLDYIVGREALEWDHEGIEIKKIDNGETILVFAKERGSPYRLKLNKAEKKVTLKITDEKIYEYPVKEEGNKLKVYKKINFI